MHRSGFSMQSLYNHLERLGASIPLFYLLWSVQTLLMAKIIMWLAYCNCLTKVILKNRGFDVLITSVKILEETLNLLFTCPISLAVSCHLQFIACSFIGSPRPLCLVMWMTIGITREKTISCH